MSRVTVPRRLTTERLTLAATCADHGDALWAAVTASIAELRLWMPWAIDPHHSDTMAFAMAAEKQWDAGSSWNFTIVENDDVIGSVGLDNHDAAVNACNLGYWLRTDRAGRGLMTEAAARVVTFGLDDIGLHRIELRAARANEASARVAEKLGFRREGLLRDGSRGADGYHDTHLYALLSTDARPDPP
jgi:ribosomal-protein-serine acetyltransferase